MKINQLVAKRTTAFKKASQLSTLCGVDVAMIMYHKGDSDPDVFCSKLDSVNAILDKYLSHSKHQKADVVSEVDVPYLSARIKAVNERIDHLRSVPTSEPKLDDTLDFDLDNIDFCFDDSIDLDFGLDKCEERDVKKIDNNIGFSLDDFGFDKIEDQGVKKIDDRFNWFNQLVSC